ncbi:50S ribosomal protein L23 [Mycoplasma corogypsi]|uniref:50S ribosomal protein L23 n=1 Tax=Mycoplasma corogypsi TaxID=2106 RepID=UPI003872BD12
MELTNVIKAPILTEKTDTQRTKGVFTFKVDYHASKFQIKNAVETIFKVKVTKVNTIKVEKQPKRVGRFNGFTNRYKKAMIWVSKDSVMNYLPEDEAQKAEEVTKATTKAAKAAKATDVEAKVAAKLAKKPAAAKAPKTASKTTATKAAKAPVKKTTTKRKVGGE